MAPTDQSYYLVGHDQHTDKHLALGPYDPGEIAAPARGKATIKHHLSDGYPHLEESIQIYHVTGAADPIAAWWKVADRLERQRS